MEKCFITDIADGEKSGDGWKSSARFSTLTLDKYYNYFNYPSNKKRTVTTIVNLVKIYYSLKLLECSVENFHESCIFINVL